MATPKTVIDGSTDLDEGVLNLFLRAGKSEVKANWFHMKFTATTNAVDVLSWADSDGEVVSGDLAWNATDVRVEVTLTGFTLRPVPFAVIARNFTTNVAEVRAWPST